MFQSSVRFVCARLVEHTGRKLFFALQSGRLLQSQADPQDVVIARREPFAGIFVGVAGFVERRADSFERRGECGSLFVEFQCADGYFTCVFVLCVVFPEVGDQFQQCEQIRRRRNDDFFVIGIAPDGRVGFQCFQECRSLGMNRMTKSGELNSL